MLRLLIGALVSLRARDVSLKRVLLILAGLAILFSLTLVKGMSSDEPITILKARVMPLHVPDNNRDRLFTREDVHLLGGIDAQPVETREIALQCGNYAMRINPMTGVAYSGHRRSLVDRAAAWMHTSSSFRTHRMDTQCASTAMR